MVTKVVDKPVNDANNIAEPKIKFSFADIDKAKLELDMLKEREEKEKVKDKDNGDESKISTQINNLTEDMENLIQQQEASDPNAPAIISQNDSNEKEPTTDASLPVAEEEGEILFKQSFLESEELEATPQVSNPKTIAVIPPRNDDGSRSAVSSIQNSSSIHRAKVSNTFSVSGDKDKYVSLNLEDIPLRVEGKFQYSPIWTPLSTTLIHS